MNWIRKRSSAESIKICRSLVDICSKNGGPLCKKLSELFYKGAYLDIIDFKIDYTNFDREDCLYARQIQAFLQKQDFLDLGVDKEAVAFKKFLECEEKCRDTNRRLRSGLLPNGSVSSIFHATARKIASILGDVPSLDSLDFSFGPGATTNVPGSLANPRVKLDTSLVCGTQLLPVVGSFLAEFPNWVGFHSRKESDDSYSVELTVQPGKLSFVPKDCRTHRPIVVEPLLSGLYQKGFGLYIKKRLRMNGLDLTSQTRNQELARIGSLDNSLATIDLSSASDTISEALVWELLPYDWADALSYGRSSHIEYKGRSIRLEKFSSMGNAYTFELESLIFYAFALSVCEELSVSSDSVSVFGDDIIIPGCCFSLLKEVLEAAGFQLNEKKSFSEGPFRESCGTDYYLGFDIRPFYLREEISERILFLMHNWFRRSGEWELANRVFQFTQPSMRLFGPDGYGDGHLIGDYSLRTSRKMRRGGWEGGYFDTYSLRGRFFRKKLPGDYLYPQYTIYVSGHSDNPSDPDRVRGSNGYAKMSIYTLARSIYRPD